MAPQRHMGALADAAFNREETRILTCSERRTARLWNILLLSRGNFIEIACEMPDHGISGLKERYGIAIGEPSRLAAPGCPRRFGASP